MKKNVKHLSQAMSLGLCAALLATTALAATAAPYTGAAADITAPAGQQATLLVDGKVTRFDGSDAVYTDADKAEVVYTDDLDDASSRLSSFTAGGADETDNDYAYHAALFVDADRRGGRESPSPKLMGDGRRHNDGTHAGKRHHRRHRSRAFNRHHRRRRHRLHHRQGHHSPLTPTATASRPATSPARAPPSPPLARAPSSPSRIPTSTVSGVAKITLFADSGSTLTVRNSTLHSDGGTLHARLSELSLSEHHGCDHPGFSASWALPAAPIWRATTPP